MKDKNIKKFIGVVALVCMGLFLLYFYIFRHNNLIKTWDHSTYWLTTLGQKYSIAGDSFITTIKNIFFSINHDDYNLLASFLLQPIFIWTSGSFFAYGMSIFFVGVLPIYLIYVFLFRKIFPENKNQILFLLCFLLPFVFSPSLHVPCVDGYLDVIGLIPIGIILYCTYQYNFEKLDWKKTIILAVCFLFTIVLRRYYVYFTVSYFVTLAIVYTVEKFILKKGNEWFRQGIHVCIVGALFSFVVLLFFHTMIRRIIEGDYTNSYSAYSFGNFFYQIFAIIKNIGIGTAIIYVFSIIYTMVKHKEKREFFVILLLNLFLTIILFNRVQTMSQHHYYTILLNLLIPVSITMVELLQDYHQNKNKKWFTILVISGIYIVCNFIFSIYPLSVDNINFFGESQISYRGVLREQLKPVMKELKKISKKEGVVIYTVASSGVYNNETFANYDLPETKLRDCIIATPNVDLRDGFSTRLYDADYLLVVNPKQLHLKEEDQQVVSIIYDALENDSPLKDNYESKKKWKVSDATIELYKKVSDYGREEKEYLKEQFNKSYKEYKDLFENRIME